MNICFVCNEFPPTPHGGIGTFVKGLAQHLVARGQGVVVVGYDPTVTCTQWQIQENVSVLRIASPYRRWPKMRVGPYSVSLQILLERWYLSQTVQRICGEMDIELVESYDWSGPLWFRPRNAPLVVRMHGANTAHAYYEGRPISRLLRYMERRNVQLADALVSVSIHIGTVTLKALELDGRDFRVIYNGVDTRAFRPQPVDRAENEILYVGSLHRRKGIFELMQAWPLVTNQIPQATLSIVGRIPEGQAGEVITRDLLKLMPESARWSVRFAGYVPHEQLPWWYSRSAVAVFPSHAEAFGLTCAEAMACSTAVVMTCKGSGPELVEDGVSGLLVEPSDIEALAGAIVRLLRNPELRRELGTNAHQRVLQRFDSAILAEQNLSYYQSVIHSYHVR